MRFGAFNCERPRGFETHRGVVLSLWKQPMVCTALTWWSVESVSQCSYEWYSLRNVVLVHFSSAHKRFLCYCLCAYREGNNTVFVPTCQWEIGHENLSFFHLDRCAESERHNHSVHGNCTVHLFPSHLSHSHKGLQTYRPASSNPKWGTRPCVCEWGCVCTCMCLCVWSVRVYECVFLGVFVKALTEL